AGAERAAVHRSVAGPVGVSMKIGDRHIGPDHPPYIIAEIGVNHDGRLDTALRLVDAAAAAGADAVKLQVFRAGQLLHASSTLADYQKSSDAASPMQLLAGLELTDVELVRVVTAIEEAGLIPLATPFSPADVDRIAALGLPAVKLASPDLVNPLLLDVVAQLGLPMLLSTGTATLAEVSWATTRLHANDASFALLQCVSSYPTADGDAQLGAMRSLNSFGTCVGYSDHTQNLRTGALAVAAGASIIEKHLTHDRNASGPDHAASADPQQFANYVRQLRNCERMLGKPFKHMLSCEEDVRNVSRQSLVTARPLRAGQTIALDDLTCMRPGIGIPAMRIDDVVGLATKRDLAAGEMLVFSDLIEPALTLPTETRRAA
ncbi:MAG: N-acetylneuraminate synthase family protein, partial [Planctomycetota bacterium]